MKHTIARSWNRLGHTGRLVLGLTFIIFVMKSFSNR